MPGNWVAASVVAALVLAAIGVGIMRTSGKLRWRLIVLGLTASSIACAVAAAHASWDTPFRSADRVFHYGMILFGVIPLIRFTVLLRSLGKIWDETLNEPPQSEPPPLAQPRRPLRPPQPAASTPSDRRRVPRRKRRALRRKRRDQGHHQ